MLFCLGCKKWEVSPDDLYCSWCGEPLTRLTLAQDVIPFYPVVPGEELQGALTLINSGSRPLTATVSVPAGFTVDGSSATLEPGEEVAVPFTFRAPQTANWSETFTVLVKDGAAVQATVICGAPPRFEVEPSVLNVVEGDRGPFTVTLRHVAGGPAFVTAVRARSGRLDVNAGPGRVEPGGELQVELVLAEGPVARGDAIDETLEIELLNHMPLTVPVEVRAQRPPRLEVNADHIRFGDVLPGRTRRRVVRLINAGEAPLIIHQIRLEGGDDLFTLELPGEGPYTLRRRGELDVAVTVHSKRGGEAKAKLFIATNDDTQLELHLPVKAHILENLEPTTAYVGIDFGTTHSCIAVARKGEAPRVLVLDESVDDPEEQVTMPSCVWWPQPPQQGNLRDCVVGRPALAKAQSPLTAHETVVSIKRKMGQRHPERIRGISLMPAEIAARIIRYMVDAAEEYLGALVHNAVVTVPANFTPPQVRATVEACRLAGLNAEVVRKHMMDEPVGAAVDYLANYEDGSLGDNFHALVYDFGGGTLDISIIKSEFTGGRHRMMVAASKGDNNLGGDDLTELLRLHLQQEAAEKVDGTLLADPPEKWETIANAQLQKVHVWNYTQLRWAAEKIKRKLSDDTEASHPVELQFMVGRDFRTEFISFAVSRSQYEVLIKERLESSKKLIDRALRAAGLGGHEIPLVLLVGMSSRTPLVRRLLEKWFGLEPVLHKEPKACVARGAHKKGELALLPQASAITELIRELDRTNCRYGIIALDRFRTRFQTIIPEGEPLPVTLTLSRTLWVNSGQTVVVALNRGDDDLAEGNPEVSRLGEIVVDEIEGTDLPLEVVMTVENHHGDVAVTLRVNGQETPAVTFKED